MNGGGTIKADFNTMVLVRWLKAVTHGKTVMACFSAICQTVCSDSGRCGLSTQRVDVHSDSYNSVLGEAGTRVVMTSLWATRPLNLI